MADPTAEQLTAQLQQSPQFRQWWQQRAQQGVDPWHTVNNDEAKQAAAQFGIPIPEGYHVSLNGIVEKDEGLGKFLLKNGAIAGGVAGGAFALPALFGGGGAAAGTAAGSGIPPLTAGGTAPAVSGIAGGMPSWLGPAVAAAVPTVGRMATKPPAPTGGALSPEILQLLQEFMRRQQQQGPLADAVTAQAQAGLPRMK